MTHYRQIIINTAVEDETSEQQMEELETGLQEVVLEELCMEGMVIEYGNILLYC